jgi:hypothetical protein
MILMGADYWELSLGIHTYPVGGWLLCLYIGRRSERTLDSHWLILVGTLSCEHGCILRLCT